MCNSGRVGNLEYLSTRKPLQAVGVQSGAGAESC